MTDTLTDRERELVEAARKVSRFGLSQRLLEELDKALRAYDPPKVKKYTMPSWEEFADGKRSSYAYGGAHQVGLPSDDLVIWVDCTRYNAIREALATEE